ncbi:MAG TPA: AraC family transcriptional regulator [Dyella sp.]|uniref:AraC family transcriptional regulator n=1 Tax=Dyella sp. TaxID=1869338 RepID=UPI002F934CB5
MSIQRSASSNWLELRRDEESGIESLRAHFQGHAYDAHAHDELLVGVTLHGVQRFRCRRAMHTSTKGRIMVIEPGAVHDGHAPEEAGFTYAMLYIPRSWMESEPDAGGASPLSSLSGWFRDTLGVDERLRKAILRAFAAVHGKEGRLARDLSVEALLRALKGKLADDESMSHKTARAPAVEQVRDFIHANLAMDIGLADLVRHTGMDRFRLNRMFTAAIGQSPHAYLVNVRLREARRRLAAGEAPADVAATVGFADQSHLGRWFRRAYGLGPGAYQQACTNVL